MARKRFTAEQIISKLREAEVALAQGQNVGQVCKRIGVSEQTYYRWRKEYGGLRLNQAKRLKALEKENARLKKVVANLTLDNDILREAASETSKPGQEEAGGGLGQREIRPAGGLGTQSLPGSGTGQSDTKASAGGCR